MLFCFDLLKVLDIELLELFKYVNKFFSTIACTKRM